jgi:hypothetical protein
VDWKRAADGIGLCIFASFLLLNTTGVLPWSFWFDAIALWPLLVMGVGIQIAFEKTRAPWLVLLSPALTLGGLLWVASGSAPESPVGPWKSEDPLPRPESARKLKLDFDLFGTRLLVAARSIDSGSLVDARSVEKVLESHLVADEQGDTARVRLVTTRHPRVNILPNRSQIWDIGIPSELPAELQLRGAMNRSKLDLSRGRFEGGTIDGAFLATELTLPAVEQPVKLVQNGAFNALRLIVPEGTPVNVHGNGLPFNVGKRRVPGEPGRAGYEVQLQGAFCAISIETRRESPKPEAEPTPPAPSAPSASPTSPTPVRG